MRVDSWNCLPPLSHPKPHSSTALTPPPLPFSSSSRCKLLDTLATRLCTVTMNYGFLNKKMDCMEEPYSSDYRFAYREQNPQWLTILNFFTPANFTSVNKCIGDLRKGVHLNKEEIAALKNDQTQMRRERTFCPLGRFGPFSSHLLHHTSDTKHRMWN